MLPGYAEAAFQAIEANSSDCPHYMSAVRAAFVRTEPIFVRAQYEEFFLKCASTVPGWIQSVIVQSALSESSGAELLYKTWQAISYDEELEQGLIKHASDESYHSRLFIGIVLDAFPRYMNEHQAIGIQKDFFSLPRPTKSRLHLPERIAIDYIVQINLSEIRTLMNLYLIAPILFRVSPKENKDRLEKKISSLYRDEISHISYTAKLVERWASQGDENLVSDLFLGNMEEFNTYTLQGTIKAIDEYGDGQFPSLLSV